jgi:hypothetical protein
MNERYNLRIRDLGIEDVPVAYRSDLGKNNIHLAKQAFDFIKAKPNAYVMIGDFTGFFDNLDHQYLKRQWCSLLGVRQLPPDYYTVFKNITRYSTWELEDLLELNGLPAVAFREDGVITTVFQVSLGGGRINGVFAMRNPDKLVHLQCPAVG